MYAYSGWNAAIYIAGEVRAPERNVPWAIAIGTVVVAALYLALNAVFLRVAPIAELAGQIDVARVAAVHIFGAAGGRLMSGLICIGLVASISAMTWIGPRVSMVMGEDHRLLAPLGWKTARGVPAVGLLAAVRDRRGTAAARNVSSRLSTMCSSALRCVQMLAVCGVFLLRAV